MDVIRASLIIVADWPERLTAAGRCASRCSRLNMGRWMGFHERDLMLRAVLLAFLIANGSGSSGAAAPADPPPEYLVEIRHALGNGHTDVALQLATKSVEAQPDDAGPYVVRAEIYSASANYDLALADYDRAVRIQPKLPELYNLRGDAHFKAGKFDASVRDYDRFIEMVPDAERSHWKRGIACYYAGEYNKGRRQFEGYQTFDDNDVENAVWRFLCIARSEGIEAGRHAMLKIRHDGRVPMMKIYYLFSGKAEPPDVLAEAQRGEPARDELNGRLFYAHLYLGLYYEVSGDGDLARSHLSRAAEMHRIGHYMWEVARVHTELLKKAETTKHRSKATTMQATD